MIQGYKPVGRYLKYLCNSDGILCIRMTTKRYHTIVTVSPSTIKLWLVHRKSVFFLYVIITYVLFAPYIYTFTHAQLFRFVMLAPPLTMAYAVHR